MGCDNIQTSVKPPDAQISTHTSRVGCDQSRDAGKASRNEFLLTHPVWDVTGFHPLLPSAFSNFYSHIPCGMWQAANSLNARISSYFYSHIPCGMWLLCHYAIFTCLLFLLTHPVWDVTVNAPLFAPVSSFLLTHPVWDVTTEPFHRKHLNVAFLLTHPVWDVTFAPAQLFATFCISTHTSRVGCDLHSQ